MARRTVRPDPDAKKALKRGLRSLQEQVRRETGRTPYDIHREFDLGPGGYAIAPPGNAVWCPDGASEEARPMMLVDTGPPVALFDPKNRQHHRCAGTRSRRDRDRGAW